MKKFNLPTLYQIYEKHVNLPDSYFKKYEKFSDFLNHPDWKSIIYKPATTDFARMWTILDFKEWIFKYKINPVKKLLVTCNDPEEFYIQYLYKRKADYELDRLNYDLHNLNLPEKDFDFILFSQTLEHLYNPYMAMERIAEHVKPGGYVFTSVPTVNIPHMTPIHFQGFTPMGLAVMFMSVGFQVIEIGQFGNIDYAHHLFTKGWPFYSDLMDKDGYIRNDRDKPMQCWILAKKL